MAEPKQEFTKVVVTEPLANRVVTIEPNFAQLAHNARVQKECHTLSTGSGSQPTRQKWNNGF